MPLSCNIKANKAKSRARRKKIRKDTLIRRGCSSWKAEVMLFRFGY